VDASREELHLRDFLACIFFFFLWLQGPGMICRMLRVYPEPEWSSGVFDKGKKNKYGLTISNRWESHATRSGGHMFVTDSLLTSGPQQNYSGVLLVCPSETRQHHGSRRITAHFILGTWRQSATPT